MPESLGFLMGFFILLLFILVPIIEIAVFIQVGDILGLWTTLGVVILTALAGTALLRQQGLSTLMRAQNAMNEGRLPAEEIFDGVCLLFAGALLLTPGFVTDFFGFLLFLPPFRAVIRESGRKIVMKNPNIHVHTHGAAPQEPPKPGGQNDPSSVVIDADFEEVEPNSNSPWAGSDSKEKS